ncbi:MAG: DUF4375 domain-containing protein [Flavobacterium sp.]|jgi:hypothetical protein
MKNINEILQLNDEIEIIEAVGTIIWDKKQESDELTEGEKHFVLIDIFEGAMNEGGFLHVFNNEVGDYTREIVEAYKKIGAPKTANIIAKAIGLFGINNFHDELEKRKNAIAKLDENALSGWEDLEEIFFNDEQEEDVVALIVEYIRNNKEMF